MYGTFAPFCTCVPRLSLFGVAFYKSAWLNISWYLVMPKSSRSKRVHMSPERLVSCAMSSWLQPLKRISGVSHGPRNGFFSFSPCGPRRRPGISWLYHFDHFAPFQHVSACGYGSIPINTIFSGMNIHLPAILMFTRGTRFWHTAMFQHRGRT